MSWKELVDTKERLAALPLMDRKGNKNTIIGTASFILPGLFITAKHNIEHYIKEHEGIDVGHYSWEPTDLTASFNVVVFLPMKDDSLVVWHIEKVHLVLGADLAILVANGAEGPQEKLTTSGIHVNLDLHLPSIGSDVVAVGYPKTTNVTIGKGPHSRHSLSLTRASGIIDNIDLSSFSSTRPPRIQSNAYIQGGMSGGPVFNQKGTFFAIVTDGLNPTDQHEHYSIFTPLAACIPQRFKLPTIDDPRGEQEKSLLSLAQKGYLKVSGLEHFDLKEDGTYTFDTRNIRCPECSEDS
jgi:hypothetical protein